MEIDYNQFMFNGTNSDNNNNSNNNNNNNDNSVYKYSFRNEKFDGKCPVMLYFDYEKTKYL